MSVTRVFDTLDDAMTAYAVAWWRYRRAVDGLEWGDARKAWDDLVYTLRIIADEYPFNLHARSVAGYVEVYALNGAGDCVACATVYKRIIS